MELTKQFLERSFKETIIAYEKQIRKLPNITLKYISSDKFLADVKYNTVNQQLIKMGAFQNFDKEYPNFLAVYEMDKNPIFYKVTGNYRVSICFELAKTLMKPFETHKVREFLKHSFAHEITHVIEEVIKQENPELWEQVKSRVPQTDPQHITILAHEALAEDMANKVGDTNVYEEVSEALWRKVIKNTQRRN